MSAIGVELAPATRDRSWPEPADWSAVALPPTWADGLFSLRRVEDVVAMLRSLVGTVPPVRLPAGVPGAERLPSYLLQSFHRMPNGYYSRQWVRGYGRGFELSMLGRMAGARARLVDWLRGAQRALDVGCGSGGLASALVAAGVPEVVGLDPSPYLLHEAARRRPGPRYVQGLAEATGFPTGAFDAAGVCFVLHELPAGVAAQTLTELARLLVPGGRLAIVEPSPIQWQEWRPWRLAHRGGVAALYFAVLARLVHEPWLEAWHGRDAAASLQEAGFFLEADVSELPFRFLLARRR